MESAAENGIEPFETTPRETKPLEFQPSCGNSVIWNGEDGLIAVAASSVVAVFHPSRMDGTVGFASWKEKVPRLESPAHEFEEYRTRLLKERETKDNSDGEKKKSSTSKKSDDVNRGRSYKDDLRKLMDMTEKMKGSGQAIEGSLGATQLFDDAYWNLDLPKVQSISWSPSMCSDRGRSVLGVVFDDASAMVFAASDGMSPLWTPLLNLSPSTDSLSDTMYLGSRFTKISWTEVLYDETGQCFSIISVASQDGRVHVWRVRHVQDVYADTNKSPNRFEERVVYIGRIGIPGESIQEMTWTLVPSDGDPQLVAVFGCTSGSVIAWGIQSSTLFALKACSWSSQTDLTEVCDSQPVLILPRDSLIVTSLACCLRDTDQCRQVVICVGKTCGAIQMYMSGEISTNRSAVEAIMDGHSIHMPHKMDSHSISGISFHCDGEIVTIASRLGNMETFKISDGDVSSIPNPVHGPDGPLAYKGYGCYGLAPSPGGHFIAVLRQSLQPDIEYKKQLQIHQKVTQGYVHIQSLVDPKAHLSSIGSALEKCIHIWSTRCQSSRNVLWDIERLVELSEQCMDKESLLQMLLDMQTFCGISANSNDSMNPCERSRRIAAMLRIQMALHMQADSSLVPLSDLELLAMRQHIQHNLLRDSDNDTAEDKLSSILALDFVVTHKDSPGFSEDIVKTAKDMYSKLGEDVVVDTAPSRPISMTLPNVTASIQGGSLNQSLQAVVANEGFTLSRCPMTLLANVDGGRWECRSCHRNFTRLPKSCHYHEHCPCAPPTCPICAGIVGLALPDWLFKP